MVMWWSKLVSNTVYQLLQQLSLSVTLSHTFTRSLDFQVRTWGSFPDWQMRWQPTPISKRLGNASVIQSHSNRQNMRQDVCRLKDCDVAVVVAKRRWVCGFRCVYFPEARHMGKTGAPPVDENQTPRCAHMAPHTRALYGTFMAYRISTETRLEKGKNSGLPQTVLNVVQDHIGRVWERKK